MNIQQTSKMTGIPQHILVRMRARDTRTLISGPPFCKVIGKNGETRYVYHLSNVREWMRLRKSRITAGDAALILGVHREEILEYSGLRGFDVATREYKGRLIIDNARNVYLWIPKKRGKK